MEISLYQLHISYCAELNKQWLEAIKYYDGKKVDCIDYNLFMTTFREAQQDGYRFTMLFDVLELINKSIVIDKEYDILQNSKFEDIRIIDSMLVEGERQGWQMIKSSLHELKIQKIRQEGFALFINNSKQNGPFYASKDTSEIIVWGFQGNVGLEILLLSILNIKAA